MFVAKDTLVKACQACINSYKGKHGEVRNIFSKQIDFDTGNCQGYFGYNVNELWIVFRGSDEDLDWHKNFNFKQISVPYDNMNKKIQVHTGFTDMYKLVRTKILNEVNEYKKQIIITGHSLGGALTTLCALDIQFNHKDKNIISIPIASPRVGNKDFADSYNRRIKQSYRIVNGEDYITKLPFPILTNFKQIQFFWHVNKLIHLNWYNPIFWIPFIRTAMSIQHFPEKYLIEMMKYRGKI